jgi:uncharacterized protein YbjQ (UPF0145 family)
VGKGGGLVILQLIQSSSLLLLLASVIAPTASYSAAPLLPLSGSSVFCQRVQQLLADTQLLSDNTVFTSMAEYRHSKPRVDPLKTYQVVAYQATIPILVSCKVKGAAHIRAAYGESMAGEQQPCSSVTRIARELAIDELQAEGNVPGADAVRAMVVENNEPAMTGFSYLADYELSYVDANDVLHINSTGLFHDYDSWLTWVLPEALEGQNYCNIPTVEYIKGLAVGSITPGTIITTDDDAPVTPQ